MLEAKRVRGKRGGVTGRREAGAEAEAGTTTAVAVGRMEWAEGVTATAVGVGAAWAQEAAMAIAGAAYMPLNTFGP